MSELGKLSSSVLNQMDATRIMQTNQQEVGDAKKSASFTDSSHLIPAINEQNSRAEKREPTSLEQVEKVLNEVNTQLKNIKNNYLQFARDDNTDKMVIYIKNSKTDEVIMQVPSEEFLRIAKNVDAYLKQFNEAVGSTPNSMPIGLITDQQV